jgi:hypothetical protein
MEVKWENRQEMLRIADRHLNFEGLCRSCGQPWPCDVERIRLILREEA